MTYADIYIPFEQFKTARFNPAMGAYDAPADTTLEQLRKELEIALTQESQTHTIPMVSLFNAEPGHEGEIHGRLYDADGDEIEVFQSSLVRIVEDALKRAVDAARVEVDRPCPTFRVRVPRRVAEREDLAALADRLQADIRQDYPDGVLEMYLGDEGATRWSISIEAHDATDDHYTEVGVRERDAMLAHAEGLIAALDEVEGGAAHIED